MKELVEKFDSLPILEKRDIIRTLVADMSQKIDSRLPRVAIVMATYNRFSYLLTYIYSVLLQENVVVKFHISDDSSSDQTSEFMQLLMAEFPAVIDYYYNENKVGPSENRKIALSGVDSDLVIFSDDDDYYIKSDFLSEASQQILDTSQDTSVFFGGAVIVDTLTGSTELVLLNYLGNDTKEVLKNLLFSMRKPPSTFLMVFRFNQVLKERLMAMDMVNDVSLYLLILSYFSGVVSGSKVPCGIYREHASNITKSLDVDFILDNIMQQIIIVKQSNLKCVEKHTLIKKHIKNNVEYFLSSGTTTQEERDKVYSLLKTQGYPLTWFQKWKYKKRYQL